MATIAMHITVDFLMIGSLNSRWFNAISLAR
jgi:hypothetical protein